MTHSLIKTDSWPIVYYELPNEIPDDEAQSHIDAMAAVLGRKERFVLVFHGIEYPAKSKQFYRLYREWGKSTRDLQKQYCLGAIRVEPDEKKRKSLFKMALSYLTAKTMPYPYKVVASFDEAKEQADRWLSP